eukprot:267016-Pyramimonas_sp.AAC.1
MKHVSLLEANEDLIFAQLSSLQGAIQRKKAGPPKHASWPDTYCKVKYLPKYWLAAFLHLCLAFSKVVLDNLWPSAHPATVLGLWV